MQPAKPITKKLRLASCALITTSLLSLNINAALECHRDQLVPTSKQNHSNASSLDRIDIYAGQVEGTQQIFTLSDNVEVSYQGQTIKTDIAEYNRETGQFTAPNTVSLESKAGKIEGLKGEFDLTERSATFSDAEFLLSDGSRGSASSMNFQESGQQKFEGVVYSGCPKDSTGWELIAPEIVLDQDSQRGYAKNVKLEFGNVPLFYLPYFSFPLNNQRKSGFLMPSFDSSDKSGFELGVPYYWNIAPHLDATFTPTFLTERGLQLQNEFRHLLPYSQGSVNLDFMFNDEKTGNGRHYLNIQDQLTSGDNWDFSLDLADVSDNNYFIDFGGSLASSAISNLNRSFSANYYGSFWRFSGLIQDYQVLDPRIMLNQEPYRRLPQLNFDLDYTLFEARSNESNFRQNLSLIASTELVNFSRDTGVEGVRVNLYPQIEHVLSTSALSLTTNLGIQHTRYELDANGQTLVTNSPSRTLPILNLDARLNLERPKAHRFLPDIVQPRAQYTYIPYRAQQDLPVFDTGLPDTTQNQLFNPERFSGIDRVGDTNQLALGLSSWLIGDQGSEKQLSANLGQIYYFDDRQVGLSNDFIQDASTSEIIAEAFWQPNSRLGIRSGLSWDPDLDTAFKRELGLSYRPSERKMLNLGYRFVAGGVDQTDIALRYPINKRMNFVGRWNYDRLNKTTLDRYWGVEYDTCCWSIRAISRKYLTDRSGNSDTTFLLQLELKGLSSVGARADRLLEDNIFIEQP